MKRKPHILLVEDELPLVRALTTTLEGLGFELRVAANGQDGLKAISEQRPDIILLDIMMPKMSGLDMLRVLREDQMKSNIPVLILTNLSGEDVMDQAKQLGVEKDAFLIKSDWSLDDLSTRIQQAIDERYSKHDSTG